MTKFRIAYEISGSVIVEAASADDAEAYFNRRYTTHELARLGELGPLDVLEASAKETEHQRQMKAIYLADVMDAALKDSPNG